jgi:hypothetical protein
MGCSFGLSRRPVDLSKWVTYDVTRKEEDRLGESNFTQASCNQSLAWAVRVCFIIRRHPTDVDPPMLVCCGHILPRVRCQCAYGAHTPCGSHRMRHQKSEAKAFWPNQPPLPSLLYIDNRRVSTARFPVGLCLLEPCMFKGTEVGDLKFSHFPGQAMGLCAFLTKSRLRA